MKEDQRQALQPKRPLAIKDADEAESRSPIVLRRIMSRYARPSFSKASIQLATTLLFYVAIWGLIIKLYFISKPFALALTVPCGLLLVRLFILQHDCGHNSLFPSKKANDIIGSLLGLLTFTPFLNWRYVHNLHHATTGNLDRRNHGDIWLMTVEEFRMASPRVQNLYKFFRNPIVLFAIGPIIYFLVRRRFPIHLKRQMIRERRNIFWTNLGIAATYGGMISWLGLGQTLLLLLPVLSVASSVGVWLFYIQHNYEDAYWARGNEWNQLDASLDGSSYYDLPNWLHWFTADIAIHHIHHADCRIPNYRLRQCMEDNLMLRPRHVLSIRESLALFRLKFWDDGKKRLVEHAR